MRLKTGFKLLVLLIFILVIGGAAALITYGIDAHPRVASKIELTTDDIARAKRLKEKYDPRKLREREISRLTINSRDLNILLGYLANRLPLLPPIISQANFMTGKAELLFTLRLPETPVGKYLNGGIIFTETTDKPLIDRIIIGRIPFSGPWIRPFVHVGNQAAQLLGVNEELGLALDALKTARFRPDQLTLVYEWQGDVAKKIAQKGRSLLLSDDNRRRLIAYNNQIARTADSLRKRKASLLDLMAPAFNLARQRSAAMGNPQAENQAAILALTLFVNNQAIAKLIGRQKEESIQNAKRIKTTLHGRTDLPKHFMISAALVIMADSGLSNVVGLFKEMDDSMGGSGFSFVDLLADQAGLRFAEMSTASAAEARQLQQQMSRSIRETDFMPSIAGLPEGLMHKTFKKRYRDMDSAAYRAERQEIKRRIDTCLLYRNQDSGNPGSK